MQELVFTQEMLVSGIILAVTFTAIFTEQLHGIERSKVAMVGAVAMIVLGQVFGFYSPEEAIEAVDWNVIFLLAGMMTIVSVMIPTGGFDWMAYKIAALSKGRQFFMLVLLGSAITVLSLLLDNVTTVVIFGPLIILIAKAQKISPIPYLLGAALLADTGGIATLVGDPPNIMIGSAADITFNNFAFHMFPITLVSWVVCLFMLKLLFRKELAVAPAEANMDEVKFADPRLWKASIAILLIMVGLFMAHNALHWEPWFVAILGMTGLVMVSRSVHMDRALEHVEFTLLIFFLGLFMIIGGVEHSQFLKFVGQLITPSVETNLILATILLMWVGAFLSAAIDNIPFTAAMIPIILGMEAQGIPVAPLWWGLAMGVGLGGNGTHIGSTANVFIVTISERLARDQNDPSLAITPGLWFRKGFPVMLATLVVSTFLFWFFFDFYAQPVN